MSIIKVASECWQVRGDSALGRSPGFNVWLGCCGYGILPTFWEYQRWHWLDAGNRSRSHVAHASRARSGWFTTITAAALVAVTIAAGGGVWWWSQRGDRRRTRAFCCTRCSATTSSCRSPSAAKIEAFDVTEVRSLVKSNNTTGNAILRIVPEGTVVKKGDFLVELDSSALDGPAHEPEDSGERRQGAEVEAHNNYDMAVIAKREYLEGTYLQERQTIESELFVAEENLNRAKEYYAYSQKLASKGYVNENQLEADRFAVEKANKDLDAAKTKLKVLDEFTKPKQVSTLESAILIAKAKWEAAQNSHQLEIEKLQDLDDQIAKCTMTAPQDGVVKYAHVTDSAATSSSSSRRARSSASGRRSSGCRTPIRCA